MMTEELIVKTLANIGVPAALAFFVLFKVNQTLRDLVNAINKLTNDVDRRLEKLEDEVQRLHTSYNHAGH